MSSEAQRLGEEIKKTYLTAGARGHALVDRLVALAHQADGGTAVTAKSAQKAINFLGLEASPGRLAEATAMLERCIPPTTGATGVLRRPNNTAPK